jgi:hypothetical protein
MWWTGVVALMGEMKNANKIVVGNLEGKRPFRRQDIDGTMLLRLFLGK